MTILSRDFSGLFTCAGRGRPRGVFEPRGKLEEGLEEGHRCAADWAGKSESREKQTLGTG